MLVLFKQGLFIFFIYLLLLNLVSCSNVNQPQDESVKLDLIPTNTTALLQAFALAADGKIWVSGHKATYGMSEDSGESWTFERLVQNPADSLLQFRDIAVTEKAQFLMSAGPGEQSRIYRRYALNSEWNEVFRGSNENVFLNSLAFFNDNHGIAYGDSFDGQLYLLETKDGGTTWARLQSESLPSALEGEGGFASSGSCIQVFDQLTAMIATGNGEKSRLLITKDAGLTWEVMELDIPAGAAKGATGLVFGAAESVWLFGGDLNSAASMGPRVQMYHIGMEKLFEATVPSFDGAIYGFATSYDPKTDNQWLFAANPNGLFMSNSENFSWNQLDSLSYWALVSTEKHIFAAGPSGRIVRLQLPKNHN